MGLSLLEILVALFIMSLAASITTFSLSKTLKKSSAAQAYEKIAQTIVQTRHSAVKTNQIHSFTINPDTKEYWNDPSDTPHLNTLPNDIKISGEIADLEIFDPPLIGFIFMPDGSSSGGHIDITTDTHIYSYRVNWLTGRLDYDKTDK